jgi:hypothetical protein
MKTAWTALAAVVFCFTMAQADEKKADGKEVELKGTITCLKCDLKKADKCTTVIQVKEAGKDVVYIFDEASGKKHHAKICKTPTKGTVKGTVSKDGDKNIVKVTDVKFE